MWSHISISSPTEALVKSREYMDTMAKFVLSRRDKMDVALFSKVGYDGEMHYYFSPQAESIAAAFGASACERPTRAELGKLLFGIDSAVVDRLYR